MTNTTTATGARASSAGSSSSSSASGNSGYTGAATSQSQPIVQPGLSGTENNSTVILSSAGVSAAAAAAAAAIASARSKLPTYLQIIGLDVATYPVPTAWSSSAKDKCPIMDLSKQGLRVAYNGAGKSDADAATVRANAPIPPQCGVFYFEVEVINKGRDGLIGVGFCTQEVLLTRLPGWEPNSYGYHGDDGHSFCCTGTGKPYGPTYTTGDIIGCCINFIDNSCFYTKNGVQLGVAFKDFKGIFFPAVGMRTPGEILEVNFGQRPFKFDIDSYVKDEKIKLKRNIESIGLEDAGGYQGLNSIVLSYLIHHGYSETAKEFAKNVGLDANPHSPSGLDKQLRDITERQKIRDLILGGDIDGAIQLATTCYPSVLSENPKIHFKLRCRKFVEMIVVGSKSMVADGEDEYAWLSAAMEYGQKLQDEYANSDSDETKRELEEIFSLLAYTDPWQSPLAHLLHVQGREQMASLLNSAILVSQNRPATPALEQVFRQSSVVLKELLRMGVGAAAFINPSDDITTSS